MLIQWWKTPHIAKGILTHVPLLLEWRARRARSLGTDSAEYCYRVWVRHLCSLSEHGFSVHGAHVGELGPGDSIGTGLAALLSGGGRYTGLDAIRYGAAIDLEKMLDEIADMLMSRQPTPRISRFPDEAIDWERFAANRDDLRAGIRAGINNCERLRYQTPWTSPDVVERESLDLVFSEGVLQCIDDLDSTYQAMFYWLRPGGFASHSIGLNATHLLPHWNGHWAFSDREWRVVRGRRPFLLNRLPASAHIRCAAGAGFEVLVVDRAYYPGGLGTASLAPRFRAMDQEDLRTSRIGLLLRKPR